MDLHAFVAAAQGRADLTSLRLCSALLVEGKRPENARKGDPLVGTVDEIVAQVEATLAEDHPAGTAFELRAAFAEAPTERLRLV